jgi:hypothetical protein
VSFRKQVILEVGIAAALLCQPRAHRVLHGQKQLDSTGAATDNGNPPDRVALTQPSRQCRPSIEQTIDRLDRHCVLGCACHLEVRRRSDIERENVVGNRWPISEAHLSVDQVEADRLVEHGACARKARQRLKVDVRLVSRVMTCDQPGQHARVRRLHHARDQRHADTREWLHAKAFEDGHVAVTAPKEHQILKNWQGGSK